RYVTYPLLTPIIAVVMTFSVLFTFTDFQLIWVLTRGGPANATHLMATLGYQRAIGGGYLGEGSAIATAMIPFLLAAILISWFGLQRRKWQHGESNDGVAALHVFGAANGASPARGAESGGTERAMTDVLASKVASPKAVLAGVTADHTEGMSYLQTLPRRLVTLYLPLSLILFLLLFPFYWMALTAIKPDEQLLDLERFNPFWTWTPTLKHIDKLLFGTHYPLWLTNTMLVAITATILSIVASVLAAYAIVRLRYRGAQWVGGAIFLAYLIPPSILFIPLSTVVFQ